MSSRVIRNTVVAILGTPDHTAGSLNSPVELEEFGHTYNEKWTYEHLASDPAGLAGRMAALLDLDRDRVRLWLLARCVQESLLDVTLREPARRLGQV